MTSRELRLWFDVIKTLPAAHSCTAALAVYGPDDDADEDGAYYPADDLIVVCLSGRGEKDLKQIREEER